LNTPSTAANETTPRPAVTADRWEEFLSLVVDVRAIQRQYRRTQDPMLRRDVARLEMQLDFTAELLVNVLHTAAAEAAVAAAIAAEGTEGGVS